MLLPLIFSFAIFLWLGFRQNPYKIINEIYDTLTANSKHLVRASTSLPGHHHIHFVRSRPGLPPLLLLHGAFSSAMPFLEIADQLASHYTVFVPDLPGWGISSSPDFRHKDAKEIVSVYVGVIAAFIRQQCHGANAPRVTILAHSFSGFLAVHLADRHPDLVERLVLLNPAGIFPLTSDMGMFWAVLFITSIHHKFIQRVWYPIFSFNKFVQFSLAQLSLPMSSSDLMGKFVHFTYRESYWKYPCLAELLALKAPVSLIYGEHDTLFPMHQGCAISLLSNAKIKCLVVRDASHAPHAHTETFLRAFWRAVEAPCEAIDRSPQSELPCQGYSACWSPYRTRAQIADMYAQLLRHKWTSMQDLIKTAEFA